MKQRRFVRGFITAMTLGLVVSLTGCASNGMYTGGENLANRTLGGALIGTAIGGLTASSNDVRGGLRSGAAIGAATGLVFGAGENYQAAQYRNAIRRHVQKKYRK